MAFDMILTTKLSRNDSQNSHLRLKIPEENENSNCNQCNIKILSHSSEKISIIQKSTIAGTFSAAFMIKVKLDPIE